MTYLRYCRNRDNDSDVGGAQGDTGVILIDILLALSLGALFIGLIAASSLDARAVFDRAQARNALLDSYEAGTEASSSSREYGNDRIETDLTLSSEASISSTSSVSSAYRQSISFTQIAASPSADLFDLAGTPLCSADISASANGSAADPAAVYSITPIILPIDPTLPLTDIQVRDGIAYISADSSKSADPDLMVVDIHDPAHPAVLSSINTGPGIGAIAVAGKRVFAAAASSVAELHVIRLDALASPVLESRYKLPLPYATATAPVGSSIFYDKDHVYLGTDKWDGAEFAVIDVSDPAQPRDVGGFETGSKINGIYVRNGIAYIADADQQQMRVLDVHDPSQPLLVASFSPSGWERQAGNALTLFEDSPGLGRTSGGFDIASDHEIFAWASTSSTTLAQPPSSLDIPGGVYGIVIDRSHVYLATRQVDQEFQVLGRDLSGSTSLSYSLPVLPQAMTCDGSSLYVLAATAPAIYEITSK